MKRLLLLLLLAGCDHKCIYETVCMDTKGNMTSYSNTYDYPDELVNSWSLKESCDILDGRYMSGLCE